MGIGSSSGAKTMRSKVRREGASEMGLKQSKVSSKVGELSSSIPNLHDASHDKENVPEAVARARQRSLEHRRRNAESGKAAAAAKRQERFGRRDERLERFHESLSHDTLAVSRNMPCTGLRAASVGVPTGCGYSLIHDVDASDCGRM